MMQHLDEYGVWIAAVAGGLTGLGWLLRKLWRGFKTAQAFSRKIAKGIDQLENNGGSTMRDKLDRLADNIDSMTTVVDGISDNVDSISGDVVALTDRFETHVSAQAEAQAAMWPAVEAIAKASPPA